MQNTPWLGQTHCYFFLLFMKPPYKNNWFKQKSHQVLKPCRACVHLWGWVHATGSDLSSNLYVVSINFSRSKKSLIEKIFEADCFGAREEMPMRYCPRGRSQSRAGGWGWVPAWWWQEEGGDALGGLGVPGASPPTRACWDSGMVGPPPTPAVYGNEEPESGYPSAARVSHFRGRLLGKWLGIFLRLWSDKALPHCLSLSLPEIRLPHLLALSSAESHYKLPLIKSKCLSGRVREDIFCSSGFAVTKIHCSE